MNSLLKALLILIGLGLVGYAVFTKTIALRSPRSAWENNLENAARFNNGELQREFGRIMDRVESGWNPVLIAGVAVVTVASLIRCDPGSRKPKGPTK